MTNLPGIDRDAVPSSRRITADYVVDALREAIQSGRLADGAVLTQVAVAEYFGVSRAPVREAMRQLRTEGLIESEAHQAAVVRGMSLEHIAELYVYRALLEGYITERATPNITPGQLAELRAMNMAMRGRDHRDWLQRDVAFHHEILRASGAKTGLELVGQLRSRVERYVHMWAGEEGMHLPAEAGTEHAQILDRIGEGDAAGARRAVEQHIRNRGQRLVAYGAVARAMRGGEA